MSFSLNPSSYTSIKEFMMLYINSLKYFITAGFTDTSLMILRISSTYIILLVITMILFCKSFYINLRKYKSKSERSNSSSNLMTPQSGVLEGKVNYEKNF